MRIGVFEDNRVEQLGPLTATRPAFDLWCGAGPLLHRHMRAFASICVGAFVRPALAELCRLRRPQLAVNDPRWVRRCPVVWVNARWLPPSEPVVPARKAEVGMLGNQVAYVVAPAGQGPDDLDELFPCLDRWQASWPHRAAGGRMLEHPGDLLDSHATAIDHDHARWLTKREYVAGPADAAIVGPAERLVVAPDARLDPLVVVDTTAGPVLIDQRAHIEAFSRLEGPCAIGPDCQVRGARVRASSLGPQCRVGGEIEASVFQGYANKCHDGFVGHSYLGEWINLGAGTQVADLRTDYRTIAVAVAGETVDTGRLKLGALLGDHVKTGLGALLNAGTVAGPFAQLLPSGSLLPRTIPAFCRVRKGRLEARTDLRDQFASAAVAMVRRGIPWTLTHEDFFIDLFERTFAQRQEALQEAERRQLRHAL